MGMSDLTVLLLLLSLGRFPLHGETFQVLGKLKLHLRHWSPYILGTVNFLLKERVIIVE